MDQFRRRSAATNGLTFLERALSSASIHHGSASLSPNITTKESPAEIKGPLGLNLLYAPSEPLVDFIFVHGLGGGSRKTWSQSENIYHYWPQEWLSRDSDFKNVRTFSFGYKADWAERNASTLGVDDFAHALLGEIKDNSDIRRAETKIVFIGHSMGGLVMKQAYLLAVQDPTFYNLVPRFHSMYFLGTPHRGSQYAKVLNNILKVSYGTKPFTSDLERNTSMVSSINESFRHVANELHLFSFYETLQTNLHLTSTIIVDKYSATLQWPNERIAYLNADHRGMCKFDLPSDSNFKVLRNALSATTEDIVTETSKSKLETTSVDKGRLQNLLGISEVPDNERITVSDARVEGSCEWLTSRMEFQSWTDSSSTSPPIFWLSGNPASGKSVLAGYVIDHLQNTNLECSYFFFKDSVASSSSIGDCLRAFAYQMALSSSDVRKCLLALESDCVKFDKNNESAMWNKLFLGSILQIKGTRPHYWIIDALDECAKFQLLIPMLTKALGLSHQIRIFITSRHNQPIDKAFLTLGKSVYNQEIVVSDTIEDIRKFVEAHMDALPVETPHSRRALTERILTMSSGSFLWVRLVVQELERVYTEEEVEDVLKDIPEDMNLLYEQILGKLSKDSRGARLAKVIFVWAVCAARPLSLDEMQCVLKLDAKATVNNLRVNINSICGQLVFVDQQSRVQMIHQSAKDFLLQKNLDSEFAVHRTEGHYRLATICLQILGRDYLRGNLMQQFVGGPQNLATDGALTEYACTFFSDHLYQSPSSRSELFDSLHNFLDTNALWWIEYLAKRDLYYIVRAATNIKAYLERRQKHFPPFGSQLRDVEAWVVDLIRVSAKFRTSLLTSPSSIHGLIPSLCPSQSIIATKYASPTRGLIVMGLSKTTWDDCLAQIDYRGKALQATSLTHGEKFFAVGLSTGRITLYHKVSGQVKGTFDHQENVKILAFGAQDKLLAASGFHLVCIWDVNSGQQQWCFDTSSRALALTFTADNQALMAPTVGNFVACWDLVKGVEKGRISWYAPSDIDMVRQPPAQALISQDWKMLAVSFRGQPILLFDLESEVYFGKLVRDQNMMDNVRGSYYHATAMAFNPNPEINVLIVSYGDGELVAFDARSLELKCRIGAVHAQTLACSPDGRTLATGSSFGTIQLFDFDGAADETLSLIYRINAYEEGIKCLAFSHDSLRLVDIRGPHCRVWEPAVLVRKVLHDGVTSDISVPGKVIMQTVGMIEGEVKADITAVAVHSKGEVVFCGKQDGCVSVYSTQDGLEHYCLYKHATNIAVNNIVYGKQRSILASADESGRLLVQKLVEEEGKWLKSQTLCDFRFLNSINGLLFSLSNEHLLVTTPESRHLWKGSDENFVHQNLPHQRHQSCKRMCHPYLPDAFIAFYPKRIRIYRWNDLEELSNPEGIELVSRDLTKSGGLNLTISCQGQHTIATLVKKRGEQASAQLQCWDTSLIKPETTKIEPFSGLDMIGPSIYHIISVTGTRLLFLDTDLWICSLNMEKFGSNLQVKRHFFIPSDWPPPTEEMQFQLSPNNDFVFVKKNELAVIKRGLEFSETMIISKAGQRQGLAVAF